MDTTENLQFDRAEFVGATASSCVMCSEPLRDAYYEVNGQVVCSQCCDTLRASQDRGSRAQRVSRALLAGAGAALAGSLLYYAILAMTGYEFGLIAIVVGVAVGKAVSWGSRGKGGWRYQAMAMVFTYLAIVSAYVPVLVAEMRKQVAPASEVQTTGTPSTGPESNANLTPVQESEPTLLGAVTAVAFLVAFICAIPFLAGFENILGLIIIGIGLYEAWKLNRPIQLAISGPHTVAVTTAASA